MHNLSLSGANVVGFTDVYPIAKSSPRLSSRGMKFKDVLNAAAIVTEGDLDGAHNAKHDAENLRKLCPVATSIIKMENRGLYASSSKEDDIFCRAGKDWYRSADEMVRTAKHISNLIKRRGGRRITRL